MVTSALCKRLKISNRPGEHTLRSFTQCLYGGIALLQFGRPERKFFASILAFISLPQAKFVCLSQGLDRARLQSSITHDVRACTFLFLRQPIRPNAPRPVAKSGSAAG